MVEGVIAWERTPPSGSMSSGGMCVMVPISCQNSAMGSTKLRKQTQHLLSSSLLPTAALHLSGKYTTRQLNWACARRFGKYCMAVQYAVATRA